MERISNAVTHRLLKMVLIAAVFVASSMAGEHSLVLGTASAAPSPKVKVCHIPPGNPSNWHTITISENALQAHLAHGDLPGACGEFCETLCDDGNACTIDACDDSESCVYAPVDCTDGNFCTSDSCNPSLGCEYEARVGTVCAVDDESPCTYDTGQCVEDSLNVGRCEPDLVPDCCESDTQCNDDINCTNDACVDNECAFTDVTCPTDACHASACDESTGACSVPTPIECEEPDCHVNGCDPLLGCFSDPIDDCCVDASQCDDGNNCTSDICNGVLGCANPPCAEGDACNTLMGCDVNCLPTFEDVFCEDDGNQCTVEYCKEDEGCVSDLITCDPGFACDTSTGECEALPCFTLLEGQGTDDVAMCVSECQARAACPEHPTYGDPCLLKNTPGLDADLLACIEGGDAEACIRADRVSEDFFDCANMCPTPAPCDYKEEGEVCDADGLDGTCQAGECVPDDATVGDEFIITFMANYQDPAAISLFISSEVLTNGVVEVAAISFSQPFTAVPGAITTINLPSGTELWTSDVVEVGAAVRIAADNDVRVYGLNRIPWTTDAYTALPVSSLGQQYTALSYWTGYLADGSESPSHRGSLAIAATEDGTTVTITPSQTVGMRPAGVPYTITMNRYDAYQLLGSPDLTGTVIESNAPIAVFGGHQCASVPPDYAFCDHLVEQIPAVGMWGTEALAIPLATRTGGSGFRILAAEDNTTVVIDGPSSQTSTINAGETVNGIFDGNLRITADRPILVGQYSPGTTWDGVVSDPFVMLIPAAEHFLTNYTFTTPSSGFSGNYVNLVALTSDVLAGQVLVDGSPVPVASFTPLPNSAYSGAQVPISLGIHTAEAPNPLGIYVYGFDEFDSYGYSGGFSGSP